MLRLSCIFLRTPVIWLKLLHSLRINCKVAPEGFSTTITRGLRYQWGCPLEPTIGGFRELVLPTLNEALRWEYPSWTLLTSSLPLLKLTVVGYAR